MIVAGFGFRSAVSRESLADALEQACDALQPTHVATAADKAVSSAFQEFAQQQGLHIIAIDATALGAQQTTTCSMASQTARGTGSVAEAAALAGAGSGANLLVTRVISDDGTATCAIAQGDGQ